MTDPANTDKTHTKTQAVLHVVPANAELSDAVT